jgi:hypothetical protein
MDSWSSKASKFVAYHALLVLELLVLLFMCGSRAFRFVAYALLVVDISIFLFFWV